MKSPSTAPSAFNWRCRSSAKISVPPGCRSGWLWQRCSTLSFFILAGPGSLEDADVLKILGDTPAPMSVGDRPGQSEAGFAHRLEQPILLEGDGRHRMIAIGDVMRPLAFEIKGRARLLRFDQTAIGAIQNEGGGEKA